MRETAIQADRLSGYDGIVDLFWHGIGAWRG
jgi:hypothetical protein